MLIFNGYGFDDIMIDASMSAMSSRKEENALDLKVKNVLFR